jgi:hypothetical protein
MAEKITINILKHIQMEKKLLEEPQKFNEDGWGNPKCPYCSKPKPETHAMCSDCYEYFNGGKPKLSQTPTP